MISYDNGQTYDAYITVVDEYINCAMSFSGQIVVIASNSSSGLGIIYYSTNYGSASTASTSITGVAWRALCISNDGKTIYSAIYNGQICKSIDYGKTFSVLGSSPTANWVSGSTDSTGQYVIYASESTIYYSSNYGSSWTAIATPSASLNWSSVVISKDGLRAIATVYGGLAYYANAIDV